MEWTRRGPNCFLLSLNRSQVEVTVHILRDSVSLLQLDGQSYVVYAKEEANGTRLRIGGGTCLLQVGRLKRWEGGGEEGLTGGKGGSRRSTTRRG